MVHEQGGCDDFKSLEAKYRLPAEYSKIPLSIKFPEGQQISLSRTKIPVELEFCSTQWRSVGMVTSF